MGTMAQANTDNKKILSTLNCRSDEDEVECLVDATAEDITEAIPYEWRDTNMPELPQSGKRNTLGWSLISICFCNIPRISGMNFNTPITFQWFLEQLLKERSMHRTRRGLIGQILTSLKHMWKVNWEVSM